MWCVARVTCLVNLMLDCLFKWFSVKRCLIWHFTFIGPPAFEQSCHVCSWMIFCSCLFVAVVWWIHIAYCVLFVKLAVLWFWCCRTVGNAIGSVQRYHHSRGSGHSLLTCSFLMRCRWAFTLSDTAVTFHDNYSATCCSTAYISSASYFVWSIWCCRWSLVLRCSRQIVICSEKREQSE